VTNSTSSTTDSSRVAPGGAGGPSTWLEGLNSPLIQEEGGDKKLKLRFDVSQYAPEEIVVKTVDNKLLVRKRVKGERFRPRRAAREPPANSGRPMQI